MIPSPTQAGTAQGQAEAEAARLYRVADRLRALPFFRRLRLAGTMLRDWRQMKAAGDSAANGALFVLAVLHGADDTDAHVALLIGRVHPASRLRTWAESAADWLWLHAAQGRE